MCSRTIALLAACVFATNARAQEARVLRVVVHPAETLHVSTWGRGEPVVMVPGIWSSTYGFRKVIPKLLPEGLSVIIIEPLGVASSSRPRSADYSMTAQARRVAAALDSLRIREALFVGQALSSSMLLRMALQSPGRIKGMVSLEGGAADEQATPGMRRALLFASMVFRIFPSQGLMRNRLRSNLENVSADKSWITPEVVDGYMEPYRHRLNETIRAYRAMAAAKESLRLGPSLAQIAVPVDLVIGAAPHFGGVAADELGPLEKFLPRLTVTRIAGAGHILAEERPDRVVAAILQMRQRLAQRQ